MVLRFVWDRLVFTQYSYYHDLFFSGPELRLRNQHRHMWVRNIETTIITVWCMSSLILSIDLQWLCYFIMFYFKLTNGAMVKWWMFKCCNGEINIRIGHFFPHKYWICSFFVAEARGGFGSGRRRRQERRERPAVTAGAADGGGQRRQKLAAETAAGGGSGSGQRWQHQRRRKATMTIAGNGGGGWRHRGPQRWRLSGSNFASRAEPSQAEPSRAEPRQNDESGNTQVAHKGATVLFPDFPYFLLPESTLFSITPFHHLTFQHWWFLRSDRLPSEGNKKWLCLAQPCYGLVTKKNAAEK